MGLEIKRLLLSGDHLTVLGFTFGVDSISEKVLGFYPFMVSPNKKTMSLSLVFDCCAFYSLS